MDIVNATQHVHAVTLGRDSRGRESVVVVAKACYAIPERGQAPELASEPAALVYADTFTGQPGLSATLHESDFAPAKQRCDVLLLGSAYAPGGRAASRVSVGLRVETLTKSFDVMGERYWTAGLLDATASSAKAFDVMPISYDRAYGGSELSPDTGEATSTYAANPVGMGYARDASKTSLLGKPVPNTQEAEDPITGPRGKYKPMAFGPIGRNFERRIRYAGTYDERWLEEHFPFLPPDFDARYFQCAPDDQQMPYPRGGELVRLVHLTPEPVPDFALPDTALEVEFTNADAVHTKVAAVVDTLILEPDQRRFSMVWRASLPLRRNIHEIKQVVIGQMPAGWYRARDLGKRFYRSLRELPARRESE